MAQDVETHYRLVDRIEKSDGSERFIYNVSYRLKKLMKQINKKILKQCYFPAYLTGSLPSHRLGIEVDEASIAEASYLQNARRHAGRGTVIRIDATNFFPSISSDLVYSVWRELLGFGKEVASLLTRLTTYQGGLAQGAPTSSYLANLALWRNERYIVQQLERDSVLYTRYVDDIVISSKAKLSSLEKNKHIRAAQKVLLSSGLRIKTRKTEVMDLNRRQTVHNTVVNSGRPTAGKARKKLLRSKVHRFNQACSYLCYDRDSLKKEYQSLDGKLREFAKLNSKAGLKLLDELTESKKQLH
ncbi:reverse transcriptase family protein [Marinobacter alexandrii]|uniref:reverse transcriptase family protein n=1 Tax=Marinobacter alexandrii TaxID=2570351 RepID=UPI00326534EB